MTPEDDFGFRLFHHCRLSAFPGGDWRGVSADEPGYVGLLPGRRVDALVYNGNIGEYQNFHPDQLRAAFLTENLFAPGQHNLVQTDADRVVTGSAAPTATPIKKSIKVPMTLGTPADATRGGVEVMAIKRSVTMGRCRGWP